MENPGTITFGDRNRGFEAGIIRHPTPPTPSCTIPFRRDPDFVDRGTLLDEIHERCSAPASRIALVGLGGVGKSQLAIEYCYRTADKSPETWVFWIHASNTARIEQSFRDIADCVKLAGRSDPRADVFKLVHDWLRNERNRKWLIVLDNADDSAVISRSLDRDQSAQTTTEDAAPQWRLSKYLPPSRHGSVLVTSRTRSVASQLVESSDIIQIEPMHDATAQALLHRKLGRNVDEDGIAELAAALEYMPLALVQAAAYIHQRAPRCSVRQYLDEFRRSDNRKTGLLDYEAGHLRRDEEAKNSIIITWQISFNHIRRSRQSAANLLSLMSFFNRQGIQEALLRDQGSTGDGGNKSDDALEARTNNEFEDDILMLRDYSFISMTRDANTFDMHRLVQLATQKWLESQGQAERWKGKFIVNLCQEFPTGNYENWERCRELFPHAESSTIQQPKSEDVLKDWAELLYKAAWYAWQQGWGNTAEEMSELSMEIRIRLLNRRHTQTLRSMAMAGLSKGLRGKWKEAEQLEVQVMETSVKELGERHPDTLSSMANLASTYRNQGRLKEAEQLEVQVMEARKKELGERHPDTLNSIANLASTYWNQGRWKEAEQLDVQVMEARKKELGERHPDTLSSMANLASTYRNQGRWKEAEQLNVQVMEARKKELGERHPDTLTSMANLASTYRNQGRWKEAEQLEVQVMEVSVKELGERHPSTLNSMANLASTYWNQGRWKEAEQLNVQVMEASVKGLGERHPDTLSSMANLASTYWNQGRWKEAEQLNVQVMEARKKELGERHPDTLTSMANLAHTMKSQGRSIEATRFMENCCSLRREVLGVGHPDALSSIGTLQEWQLEKESVIRTGRFRSWRKTNTAGVCAD